MLNVVTCWMSTEVSDFIILICCQESPDSWLVIACAQVVGTQVIIILLAPVQIRIDRAAGFVKQISVRIV